jgi:hypothetical protein
VADEDLKRLESFSNKQGNGSPIEVYDVDFWGQRQKSSSFKLV